MLTQVRTSIRHDTSAFRLLVSLGAAMLISVLAVSSAPVPGTHGARSVGQVSVAPANAQSPTVRNFTVSINGNGFDAGSLDIVVNQGDTVRITFVLDPSQVNASDPTDHHVISISGYNVQSADINSTSREATVEFTASTLGSFVISCQTPECPIHYLMLGGKLDVVQDQSTTTVTSASGVSTTTGGSSATSIHSVSTSNSATQTSTSGTSTSQSSGGSDPVTGALGSLPVFVSLATMVVVGTIGALLLVSRRAD